MDHGGTYGPWVHPRSVDGGVVDLGKCSDHQPRFTMTDHKSIHGPSTGFVGWSCHGSLFLEDSSALNHEPSTMDRGLIDGPSVVLWSWENAEVIKHGPHLWSVIPSTGRGRPLSVAPATSRRSVIWSFLNLRCYIISPLGTFVLD
uniref:Uncharacterized protein n=1 Tax=Solanum tuberosum TaxID=4113 RepID=M1DQJ3_SOLTU